MNLHQLYLKKNNCYISGKKIVPKGIMVHSTGANNPNLRRYVGPDDGLLGNNPYGNHWNCAKPDGREICCHAFVGLLKDGTVATYQTLPWEMRGWHCAKGNNGSGNNTHISFEICEDNLKDQDYFRAVFREAAELCVYLCKEYNLTEKNIIDHSEGYKLGIASNHSDTSHWFPKHGENMNTLRAAVKRGLAGQPLLPQFGDEEKAAPTQEPASCVVKSGESLWSIAQKYLGDGTRWKELLNLNGLSSSLLKTGQVLLLPDGKGAAK